MIEQQNIYPYRYLFNQFLDALYAFFTLYIRIFNELNMTHVINLSFDLYAKDFVDKYTYHKLQRKIKNKNIRAR